MIILYPGISSSELEIDLYCYWLVLHIVLAPSGFYWRRPELDKIYQGIAEQEAATEQYLALLVLF